MRRLLAVVAVVIVSLLGMAAPSAAGGNSTVPSAAFMPQVGPCGSGYIHVGHYAIGSSPTLAHMDVYWSASASRNCLVVNHTSATWGLSMYTEARIRPSGSSWPTCPSSTGCDAGNYRYYAGPVYTPSGVSMANRCLDIQGTAD